MKITTNEKGHEQIEQTLLMLAQDARPNVRQAVTNYIWWWKSFNDPIGAVDFAGDFLDSPKEVDELATILESLA